MNPMELRVAKAINYAADLNGDPPFADSRSLARAAIEATRVSASGIYLHGVMVGVMLSLACGILIWAITT